MKNRIEIQIENIKIHDKLSEIKDNIDIFKKNYTIKKILKIDSIIKDILLIKNDGNKTKNKIENFIEIIENETKGEKKYILDEEDIEFIELIDAFKNKLNIEGIKKPDLNKNDEIIDYLKNLNSKLEEDSKKIDDFAKRIEEISKKIPDFEIKFGEYINDYKKQEELLNQNFNENYEIALESIGKIYADMENDKKFNKIDKLIKDIDLKYPNLIKEDLMEMEDLIKKIREYDIQIKKNESENIEENIESYDKAITELNSDFNTKNILKV